MEGRILTNWQACVHIRGIKQQWSTTNNWNLLHFHQQKELHISALSVSTWKLLKQLNLKPIKTDLPPAPDFLLHVIPCNCKATSKNTCGLMLCTCRKNGLKCMAACEDYRGMSCENIEEERIGELNDIDDDGNIFEKLFQLWWHFYF